MRDHELHAEQVKALCVPWLNGGRDGIIGKIGENMNSQNNGSVVKAEWQDGETEI